MFSLKLPLACLSVKIENFAFAIPGVRILVRELSFKLNDVQKRALRVTWKRLTEAPMTSGRGTINIMEKAFNRLIEKEPHLMSIFYKCAFVSCIIDKVRS
jgi:hypothetical protein